MNRGPTRVSLSLLVLSIFAVGCGGKTSGANVLLGDGSVRFLSASTSATILVCMISRAGGEAFSPN